MDDERLIRELEEKLEYHREHTRRYREALSALRGRVKAKARRSGLRPGSIPSRIAGLLKEGPLTSAQITERLNAQVAKSGRRLSVNRISIALARYIREGRIFRRTEDGKYALIEK